MTPTIPMLFILCGIFVSVSASQLPSHFFRIIPPKGALIVRANTTSPHEFPTVNAAVASITNDTVSSSIFIYPGVYYEQVFVNRTGPLTIYGYTIDTRTHLANRATISYDLSAKQAGSNDLSGTVRVRKNDFSIYNVNIKNTFGAGTQAVAFAQNGDRVGVYACGLYGYQDTLYANEGRQVYLRGYIQGAVDFIFGGVNRTPRAFFQSNIIGLLGTGWVTAHGRTVDDIGAYVFDKNAIVLAPDAGANATGNVFLGRPWRDHAKVVFKNTFISAPLNPGIWSVWNDTTPLTDNILFGEYNTFGPGVKAAVRPNFVTMLSKEEADTFTISSTVGEDYATWVDTDYVLP